MVEIAETIRMGKKEEAQDLFTSFLGRRSTTGLYEVGDEEALCAVLPF